MDFLPGLGPARAWSGAPRAGAQPPANWQGDYDPWRAAYALHCRRLAVGSLCEGRGFHWTGPGGPRGLPSVLGGPRLAHASAGHSEGEGHSGRQRSWQGPGLRARGDKAAPRASQWAPLFSGGGGVTPGPPLSSPPPPPRRTSCWTLGRGGPASGVAPAPECSELAPGAGLRGAGTPTGEAASGPRARRPSAAAPSGRRRGAGGAGGSDPDPARGVAGAGPGGRGAGAGSAQAREPRPEQAERSRRASRPAELGGGVVLCAPRSPRRAMPPAGLRGAAPLAAVALLALGAPLGKGRGAGARREASARGPGAPGGIPAEPRRFRVRGRGGGGARGLDGEGVPDPGGRGRGLRAQGPGWRCGRGRPETRPGGHWAPPPLPAALAGEDCLWYLDRNGSWHPGFNCEFFAFCCGTCYQRYCCRDLSLLITERQQKHCLAFRWAPALPAPPLRLSADTPPGPKRGWSSRAQELQERPAGDRHVVIAGWAGPSPPPGPAQGEGRGSPGPSGAPASGRTGPIPSPPLTSCVILGRTGPGWVTVPSSLRGAHTGGFQICLGRRRR